jgi:hypothetical protein
MCGHLHIYSEQIQLKSHTTIRFSKIKYRSLGGLLVTPFCTERVLIKCQPQKCGFRTAQVSACWQCNRNVFSFIPTHDISFLYVLRGTVEMGQLQYTQGDGASKHSVGGFPLIPGSNPLPPTAVSCAYMNGNIAYMGERLRSVRMEGAGEQLLCAYMFFICMSVCACVCADQFKMLRICYFKILMMIC